MGDGRMLLPVYRQRLRADRRRLTGLLSCQTTALLGNAATL